MNSMDSTPKKLTMVQMARRIQKNLDDRDRKQDVNISRRKIAIGKLQARVNKLEKKISLR